MMKVNEAQNPAIQPNETAEGLKTALRERYEARMAKGYAELDRLQEQTRKSEILSAEDFNIRINCTGD